MKKTLIAAAAGAIGALGWPPALMSRRARLGRRMRRYPNRNHPGEHRVQYSVER